MHAMLQGEFALKAKAAKIFLLACTAVFCATRFAADDIYVAIGIPPHMSRIVLGIASVGAFVISLALLVLDWETHAASHKNATDHLARVLQKYRESRNEDGSWDDKVRAALSDAYWEADRMITAIPDKRFNELKAKYLRKVAISDLRDSYPNCPTIFLRLLLTKKDLLGVAGQRGTNKEEK